MVLSGGTDWLDLVRAEGKPEVLCALDTFWLSLSSLLAASLEGELVVQVLFKVEEQAPDQLKGPMNAPFVPPARPVRSVMVSFIARSALKVLALPCLLAGGCGMFLEREVHLIPDGFKGDVFIVPGIGAGSRPIRQGGASVFVVPANGILITQDKTTLKWHESRFYYVKPNGLRQRLEEVPSSVPGTQENRSNRRPIVWFEKSGTIAGVNLPCTVHYMQYYVGSRAHLLARGDAGADERRFLEFVKTGRACNS
jgi:hypothetical protein